MSPQPFDSIKGFAVTFRQIFKKPITQQYPEYKRPVYPRFRGRHRLWRHENGLEKCVGCSLCAAACPADCIRVVADENTADNRVSPGERYARIDEINLSRCIFCGYCELACPFDAITLEAVLVAPEAVPSPEAWVHRALVLRVLLRDRLLEDLPERDRESLDAVERLRAHTNATRIAVTKALSVATGKSTFQPKRMSWS